MSKILLGIIAVLISLTGFLYWQNDRLSEINAAFELRDKEQKAAIESLQNDFQLQTSSLLDLKRNIKIYKLK